jgi:hypothetical protein
VHNICAIFILLLPFPATSYLHWYRPNPSPQDLFHHPMFDFVEEKKREKKTFLLVYDKDSYTRSFLVIFLYMYVDYNPN